MYSNEPFEIVFIVLTDPIPSSSISQVFRTAFIIDCGFTFTLVLVLIYKTFSPISNYSVFAMRKWLL